MTTPAPTQTASLRNEALEVFRTLAGALALCLLIRVLLVQPFTIPSESMEPGLLVGDYVLVTKFDYGWSRHSLPLSPPLFAGRLLPRMARRGDVVVFKKPGDPRHEDVIKRVVGLPGDRVQVQGGAVWLNGVQIPRAYAGDRSDPGDPSLLVNVMDERLGRHAYATFDRGPGRPGDDTDVYQVPVGDYFVMGDNRDNSADSRWPQGYGMGFVPAENLVGRARLVAASWKPGASLLKPWTWVNFRVDRFLRPLA